MLNQVEMSLALMVLELPVYLKNRMINGELFNFTHQCQLKGEHFPINRLLKFDLLQRLKFNVILIKNRTF